MLSQTEEVSQLINEIMASQSQQSASQKSTPTPIVSSQDTINSSKTPLEAISPIGKDPFYEELDEQSINSILAKSTIFSKVSKACEVNASPQPLNPLNSLNDSNPPKFAKKENFKFLKKEILLIKSSLKELQEDFQNFFNYKNSKNPKTNFAKEFKDIKEIIKNESKNLFKKIKENNKNINKKIEEMSKEFEVINKVDNLNIKEDTKFNTTKKEIKLRRLFSQQKKIDIDLTLHSEIDEVNVRKVNRRENRKRNYGGKKKEAKKSFDVYSFIGSL